MKSRFAVALRVGVVFLLAGAAPSPAAGEPPPGWTSVDVFQTNRSPRVVTNFIEVRVPDNVFVDEFRTNAFERTITNVVEVPVTNWLTRTLTNRVAVTRFRTNAVTRYQTNWTTLTRTNQEEVTLTNWATVVATTTNWFTRTVTNFQPVTLVRTNTVERRQTNWATVTLTNWDTVLVARTNWVRQTATNLVEVTVPAGALTVAARETTPTPKADAPREPVPDALLIDAVRTARPADSTGAEVSFKVSLSSDAEAPLQVQQWRVEREDRAVLISAQAREFKRVLPPGRYQVQVRARRENGSQWLVQQGGLEVTAEAVTRR